MNTIGRLFRVSLLGESHGPGVAALLDGVPAGLPLSLRDFRSDLARRRSGRAGTTARREKDQPVLKSGVHAGRTNGAPLLIWFDNGDVDSRGYGKLRRTPRPGHADLAALIKHGGFNDVRGGGHYSGRLTAALVAAGVVAKKMIAPVEVEARLAEAGGDPGAAGIARRVREAAAAGDSVGGIVECRIAGLPAGLGRPFFDPAESTLAHAAFAIPGIKAIEFGAGFRAARMRGSEFNDPILDARGATATNHAGGINGGITNGNEVVFRVAFRPTASIGLPQQTVDLATGRPARVRVPGRHDACIALRAPVVLEAAAAVVVADLMAVEGRIPAVWR